MDRGADIIPISSRRRAPPPTAAEWGAVRHPWGVVGLFLAGLMFVAAVAAAAPDLGENIRDLAPPAREAFYRRTLQEVKGACTLPAAREGGLRDHCRRQAQFVRLFPECDAACWRTTASLLPPRRW